MQVETFMREFGRLAKWFNKSEKQADPNQWYSRVQDIPDEAFVTVVDRFIDGAKFMPTPQEVRNAYSDWLQARPEKQSIRHITWCGECGSSGVLRLEIQEKHGVRDTLYRCGSCKNWEGKIGTWVPIGTRYDVSRKHGHTLLRDPEPEEVPEDEGTNVKFVNFGARGGDPVHIRDVLKTIREEDIPF